MNNKTVIEVFMKKDNIEVRGNESSIEVKGKVKSIATESKDGLMSKEMVKKLNAIEDGANKYPHPQHASADQGLYKVQIDDLGHVVKANKVTKQDIVDLGIPGSQVTYGHASETQAGLMSSEDKKKLKSISEGANQYIHPSYTSRDSGFYKVTVDKTGHVIEVTKVTKADITGLGIPAQDTTYGLVTESNDGLMSAESYKRLNGLKNYTHPEYSAIKSGFYKIEVDDLGHVIRYSKVTKADIIALGIPGTDTTYNVVDDYNAGLMTVAEHKKLKEFLSASFYALKSDLNIDYSVITFDTSEIVNDDFEIDSDDQQVTKKLEAPVIYLEDASSSGTSAVLGVAVLGKMILGNSG